MDKLNKTLNSVILALTLTTLTALMVASTSVIIESAIAVYFWQVALTSMSLLLSLWVVMFLMLAVKMIVRWYEREFHHEGEVASSWKWLHE